MVRIFRHVSLVVPPFASHIDDAGHIGDGARIIQKELRLGKGTQVNANAVIAGNTRFEAGEYCTIGYGAVILTSTDCGRVMNDYVDVPELREVIRGSVTLGNRVFVGSNAVICVSRKYPHIRIGDDVVISSMVYLDKSVPPGKFVYTEGTHGQTRWKPR